MNNYSWLQKKLHQFILSSQFIREITFEIESLLISTLNKDDKHVFVTGLARSGSTILLNAIHTSNLFGSLSYLDMPFILAPNLWSKIYTHNSKNNDKLVERAHKDGLEISLKSPEAFEEVFWKTFDSKIFIKNKFKKFVDLVSHKYSKDRYLSKNNQNINRLEVISKIFPNSKILIPFREPTQHANSLLHQHKKFIEYSKNDIFVANYMKWIGHTEFGPNYIPFVKKINYDDDKNINHWIEQWHLTYRKCLEIQKKNQNIIFVCYEDLCRSEKYWINLLEILDIKNKYNFNFKESKNKIKKDLDPILIREADFLYVKLREINSKLYT